MLRNCLKTGTKTIRSANPFKHNVESKRIIRNRLDRLQDIFGFPHRLGIDLKIGMKTNRPRRFITKLNVDSSKTHCRISYISNLLHIDKKMVRKLIGESIRHPLEIESRIFRNEPKVEPNQAFLACVLNCSSLELDCT